MSKKLTVDQLVKINEVFSMNHWEQESELFEIFCNRAAFFEDDDMIDLFIELSKRYIRIKYNEYPDNIIELIKKIINNDRSSDKLYVMALKPASDIFTSKSGDFVAYMVNSPMVIKSLLDERITLCRNYMDLIRKISEKDKIVLIDDFVGSGDTACQCILELFSLGISCKQIIIAAIVVMKKGKYAIEKLGCETVCNKLISRGISDYYKNEKKTEYCNIMEKIEDSLKVSKKFRFGYKKSEGLVSMIRTPNNTFPVFWLSKNNSVKAPFER